jgi:hypothetical protein
MMPFFVVGVLPMLEMQDLHLAFNQPLTEMSTRILPGVKALPACL